MNNYSSTTQSYLQRFFTIQAELLEENYYQIHAASKDAANSLSDSGMIHVFGSGHSEMVAKELVGRAGGLVPINPIYDATGGWAENTPGFGSRLFDRYKESYQVRPGEIVIVVSNSGKNASPLEVALAAKEAGAIIVAVTSKNMSSQLAPANDSGKRLYEIADYVFDNKGVNGDALVEAPDSKIKTGPTSTLTGALLLNLFLLETLEQMNKMGLDLPILVSQNSDGGAEHNRVLFEKYRARLRQPL